MCIRDSFDAVDVLVTDPVPAGFGSLSNISHSGTFSGGVLEWTIPTISAGGSTTVSFDAVVQ